MTQETEEQIAAEGEVDGFRKEGGPFVVAAQATRMPMVFADAKAVDTPIIFANDSFLMLVGYERDEVLGHSFRELMAKGTDPKALTLVESALDHRDDHAEGHASEVRYRRKDGTEFWAAIYISPVRDDSGDIIEHFVSFIDLTQHKEDQAKSRMLIDELNHRVKNTLTAVQSIVVQSLRNMSAPTSIRDSIEARLLSLSRSHDILTGESWTSAALHDVVDAAVKPFVVAHGESERVSITGEGVRLQPNTALALGTVLHELATNAVKYGALAGETGGVKIAWTVKREARGDRLILTWREDGGPPVTPPSRKGFGTRVIERGLAHELGGTTYLDYQPDGVVCTINIPVPQDAGNV